MFFIKIQLVFQTIFQQTKAKALLGQTVYNQLFQVKVVSMDTPPQKYRFVKGQALGKALPQGEGKKDQTTAHMDPTMCQHPDDEMLLRGNKGNLWWTCKKCLSRWERIPASQINTQTGEPVGTDRLTFGKHAGETYEEVYQNDQQYCSWAEWTVAEEASTSAPLARFVEWVGTTRLLESFEADNMATES